MVVRSPVTASIGTKSPPPVQLDGFEALSYWKVVWVGSVQLVSQSYYANTITLIKHEPPHILSKVGLLPHQSVKAPLQPQFWSSFSEFLKKCGTGQWSQFNQRNDIHLWQYSDAMWPLAEQQPLSHKNDDEDTFKVTPQVRKSKIRKLWSTIVHLIEIRKNDRSANQLESRTIC